MVLIRSKLFRRIWIILVQAVIFVEADNYFCENEEFLGRKFFLRKMNNHSVQCMSVQQINWTFNETIATRNNETRLPFLIESQWKSCQPEFSWNGSLFYFVSTLNVTSSPDILEEGPDWSRTVSCGSFGGQRSLGDPSIHLKRIDNSVPVFVETNTVAPLQITVHPDDWSIAPDPSELVLITVDRAEATCVCQIRSQLVQPKFINCDNLVHCDFLARQFNARAHPGTVNVFCQTDTMGFLRQESLNVSSPGILMCAGVNSPKTNLLTADFAPYAPFLPLTFVDPLLRHEDNSSDDDAGNQKIIVLTNKLPNFKDFLAIKQSWGFFGYGGFELTVHSVECSGPKFLFLSDFRFRPMMDEINPALSIDQMTEIFSTKQTTEEADLNVTSTWTLKQRRALLTDDLHLTVFCEAAVRNGNGIVEVYVNITIPAARAMIDPPVIVRPGITPNCTKDLNFVERFQCHFEDLTFHCSNVSVDGNNWTMTCDECPGVNISCVALIDQQQNEKGVVICVPQLTQCIANEKNTTITSTARHTSEATTEQTTFKDESTTEGATPQPNNEKVEPVTETDGQVNLGVAILVAVAIVASMLTLAGFGYLQRRRIRRKFRKFFKGHGPLPEHVVKEFLEGKNSIDPNDLHGLIYSQPFNSKFEIRRRDLALDPKNLLGAGQYGNVMKGFLRRDTSNLTNGHLLMMTVAVKTIKPNADLVHFKALLAEIKILTHLGRHQNIIRFIGASTENIKIREIFVVVEFCVKGDLQKLLRRSRSTFQNLLTSTVDQDYYVNFGSNEPSTISSSSSVEQSDAISTLNLLSWAVGIANGMAYLGFKKVIHGDLAARNVLISEENVAKVSDFSLSHQLVQNYDSYTTTQKMPMPWKYMSLEALQDLNFSTQSDVWSFGVTLWEMFSLGSSPYAGSQWNKDFMDRIMGGYRLDKPPFADDDVYDLMMKCWNVDPEMRPKFPEIYNRLQKIFSNFESSCNGDYYTLQSTHQEDSDV